MTTKGLCTDRGDDEYNNYVPIHPEYYEVAAPFDSDPLIPFVFGPRDVGLPPRPIGPKYC